MSNSMLAKAVRIVPDTAAPPPPVDHTLSISRSNLVDFIDPSEFWISPFVTVTVYGGTGPFIYEWTHEQGYAINVNGADDGPVVQFSGQEFHTETFDLFWCKVTDTGNGNLEKTIAVSVTINWDAT